jgi:PPOX class probable F420-dependent enzyme
MTQPTEAQQAFIARHRVAHLATGDARGRPHVVPICYAYDGRRLYMVIDSKPKRVSPLQLRRLRNIRENPQVAVVVDDYSDDWSRLAYVMIRGRADVLEKGEAHERALRLLRAKYPQYRKMALEERPVIRITPESLVSWGAIA